MHFTHIFPRVLALFNHFTIFSKGWTSDVDKTALRAAYLARRTHVAMSARRGGKFGHALSLVRQISTV